jgi:hypothetical protein
MKYALTALLALAAGPALAAVVNIAGGELGKALLWLIGWALILYVLWWALGKFKEKLGEPWGTVGMVLLVVLTAAVVIDFIATVFFGSPLFSFR